MLIVADSSALVALSACDALETMSHLFDDFRVPQAVYDEVVIFEKPHYESLKSFLVGRVTEVDLSKWVIAEGGLGQGELDDGIIQATLSRLPFD